MAVETGQLLSFSASGTIGKTIVYASWRGRRYARRWVKPHNPRSAGQTSTREVFAFLQQAWKEAPATVQTPWTAFATARPFINRNAWSGQNVKALRNQTTLAAMLMAVAAHGGIAPLSISVTPGSAQIAATLTAPPLPAGWAIANGTVAVIADQDPHVGTLYLISSGQATSSPYTVTLTGLAHSQLYRVFGWFQYTKANNKVAYGPQAVGSGTTT